MQYFWDPWKVQVWWKCILVLSILTLDVKEGQQIAWATCLCSLLKLFPKLPGASPLPLSHSILLPSHVISFPTIQHILRAPLTHTCAGGLQDFVMEEERSLEVSQSTTSCGVDGSLISVCNYWVEVIPGLSSLLRLAGWHASCWMQCSHVLGCVSTCEYFVGVD